MPTETDHAAAAARRGPGPARTAVQLADGRELLYFDDVPGLDRSAPDQRVLPPHAPRSEVRYDPVQGEWVVVAAHRQDRTHLPAPGECPLCPSAPGRQTEIPASGYHVVAFENRFPTLGGPPAGGRCEVVCFTDDHESSFSRLTDRRLETVARAWTDRTVELSRLPGVEYVFVFENRGPEIGATLQHPHGQIYAFPYLPARVARALDMARAYRAEHRSCLFCSVVAAEEAAERVVARTDGFVAFVPEAARWPYEVHIYPRRHVGGLPELEPAEQAELMSLYRDVLARFDRLFDAPAPYMAHFQQAPAGPDAGLAHLSARIFTSRRAPGKLKYLAASESGAGAFINDVLPEQAARRLREAGTRPPG
ncbi:galactose-1-phosphate uridylyltransferase [Actinomadura macrotermitis]|uniref:Galactose-1-phosphate uridylyltransferase n=1 Tax=Actinomadura macrotermitis TaxID=2585200 RepID=A0A7K0C2J9_9ACTN|nr:galactose-1-phosphate uridylyltransferase [Actinomadura macrotermitis]MQY07669.1 Galactose-1-phosphate uridylyltransferase [Actinomadura macrotermitis]